MSRSIHTTRHSLYLLDRTSFRDRRLKREQVDETRRELQKKRRIKSNVQQERRSANIPDMVPIEPDIVPVNVVDSGKGIIYPFGPADIQAVVKLLPQGLLDGISEIRLELGREACEKWGDDCEEEDDVRDPLYGRRGMEFLPGIHAITLHAYVGDELMANRLGFWTFLKLNMLFTFVHELAHHDDHMRRTGAGRWRPHHAESARPSSRR